MEICLGILAKYARNLITPEKFTSKSPLNTTFATPRRVDYVDQGQNSVSTASRIIP